MVSAAAALIWSSTTDANSNGFTNDDVVRRLLESADAGPDTGTTSKYGGAEPLPGDRRARRRGLLDSRAAACSRDCATGCGRRRERGREPERGPAGEAGMAAAAQVPAGRYRRSPTLGPVTLTVDRKGRISQVDRAARAALQRRKDANAAVHDERDRPSGRERGHS